MYDKSMWLTWMHLVSGEVPGMQSRAPHSLPGSAGFPHQRHPAKISRAAHRDHRRIARPQQQSNHGAVQRVLGEVVLLTLHALRQEDLRRLQGGPHGHPAARNCPNQQPSMTMADAVLCPLKIHIIMRQTLNFVQIFKLFMSSARFHFNHEGLFILL